MDPRIDDSSKSVLISGTSSGIGYACAQRLAERGWTVFAGLRDPGESDIFNLPNARVVPVELDVTNQRSIDALRERLENEFGLSRLDGLVNNAGVALVAPFDQTSLEHWQRIYSVNVFGVVALTRAVLPMLRNARGRIVNLSSSSAAAAPPFVSAYGSSKRALEALSESLRAEYAADGITVSIVAPDVVDTPIWEKAVRSLGTLDRGPYRRSENALGELARHLAAKAGTGRSPMSVADTVEHALSSKEPSDRYELT